MKWVLLACGALVVLVVAIVAVGAMLPREHRASRRARFRQPPEAVYALVTGPQDWRPDVAKWEQLAPENGRQRSRETSKGGDALLMEVVESVPSARHVTRIADPDLPYGGTWTWSISPIDGGCQVQVAEDGFVSNPIFRFVSRFVIGHQATIDAYLKNLGKKLGDEIVPE